MVLVLGFRLILSPPHDPESFLLSDIWYSSILMQRSCRAFHVDSTMSLVMGLLFGASRFRSLKVVSLPGFLGITEELWAVWGISVNSTGAKRGCYYQTGP